SNYLVKQVAAVRLWDDVLNFGLMTSIEVDEAFEPFYRTQNLVLASVALIVALLLTLSAFIWLLQQRRHLVSQASSLQLRAVLDASPDAILVFDHAGVMVDLNSQAALLFQCAAHEVPQDFFTRLQVLTPECVQQAKDGQAVNIEDELLLDNGLFQPVGIRLRQLTDHQSGSVMAIIQDLTAHKHAEDEQQRLEQAQRLESLGVLAGGVAHDFNNILMTVIGNAALIRGRLPEEDVSLTNLERIESASRRAADLCKQMLAYSGQGQFVVQTVDLSEQLHEISKLMEVSTSKKVPLTLDLASCMPKCDCDVSQLQQIMLNLVGNANEAIGDDKGRIVVRTGSMQVDEHWLGLAQESEKAEVGEFVYIEVEDDGSGMDDEVQKRIFEPFFTTKFTGRGLGMSAVQGIMRGHEGILFFQSAVGKGSIFRVAFPVSEVYVQVMDTQTVEPVSLPHRGMALVVDDESDVRALVCDMLTKLDYEALIAENGKQALEVYALHRDEIEFVLLDLMMPEMNGDECLEKLKALNPDVQIILSSGYSEPLVSSHLSHAKLQGMIDDLDFLQKPYDIEQLALSIQRLKV
ncbi:MAG: response regulator, partial [Mariprofundaceae bacterium]|nr:response regulator [Mariprofundaceae bacterium]